MAKYTRDQIEMSGRGISKSTGRMIKISNRTRSPAACLQPNAYGNYSLVNLSRCLESHLRGVVPMKSDGAP
jgi:hypothetical protein